MTPDHENDPIPPNKAEQDHNPEVEVLSHPVYYVRSEEDNDKTVLVAIDARIVGGDQVTWFDTVKYRRFGCRDIQYGDGDTVRFVRIETGVSYTLAPLSLSIYNQIVRPRLLDAKVFYSEEDMLKTFLETRGPL